jgi:hypothetical protein
MNAKCLALLLTVSLCACATLDQRSNAARLAEVEAAISQAMTERPNEGWEDYMRLGARACDAGIARGCFLAAGTATTLAGMGSVSSVEARDYTIRACELGDSWEMCLGVAYVNRTVVVEGEQSDDVRIFELLERACHLGGESGCRSVRERVSQLYSGNATSRCR